MANNTTRRDVELRINANDLSQKSLSQLLETFTKLQTAQEQLNKAGDGTQRSVRELKQDLTDLQAVAVELKSRASLVDQFTLVEKRAGDAATRVGHAKEALAAFNAKQAEGAELSKKQQGEFNRLSREVANSEKNLARTTAKLAEFNAELQQMGAGDTNATRDTLLKFSGDLGTALAGAEASIRRYDEVLRANIAKEKDATEQKKKLALATTELKKAQDTLGTAVTFNSQGREALRAASNIEALTKDYDALAASSHKAGDGIRAIIDPSRQAMTSIDGLETQTQKLNEQLSKAQSSGKLREEIKKLRSEYSSLANDAGKAATALADDIGAYRQTEQAVGSLRARIEDAQQTVRKFASQMSVAAEPSEKLAKSLSTAKTQLATLVADFERQSVALARMKRELQDAGVNTDNLAAAEKRLEGIAHGVVTAQRALGSAAVQVGDGAKKGKTGLDLFEDSGRKSLSTAQRLRGELLSLAASYLGLFAAVNVATASIEASASREGILRRLELVEGTAEGATKKFKELRAVADEIGVDFEQSAKGFSDIAIGAKEAGVSSDRLDHFYRNLAKTTRGLSLDGEKTGRVFTAVSQVFGKNKLQSEELVQQLGEHLPGIVAIAQKALNLTSQEMTKALEEGRLSAESLIVIFDEYARKVDTLSKNDDSIVDSLTRFKNALFDLKLAIGDSGFLDTFTQLLKEAAAAIKGGELNDAIKGLGSLLRLAGEAARFLLEHVDLTVGAFVLLISYNVGKVLFGIGTAFLGLTKAVGGTATILGVLRGALTLLAAHPIAALVIALGTLLVSTETGRAGLSALWQVVVEVGGAIGDLLQLNFAAFAERVSTAMGRVSAAFKGAKKDADDLSGAGEVDEKKLLAQLIQKKLAAKGITADIVDERTPSGQKQSTTAAGDPIIEAENKRRAEADLTKKTVERIEKDILEVRTAAAKEAAKVNGNVEAEVRAEHQKTQDKIDELFARADKTRNESTLIAAEDAQNRLNKEITAIVKAKKALAAKNLNKDERGAQNELLELAKQRADAIKEGLRLEQAQLEQSFKEGLTSLRDYYAKRLDETTRGLDAEITAAQEQIAILEKNEARDPTAAKKIVKLQGEINTKTQEKVLAERQFGFEAQQAEKALRRQVAAVQQELDELTGEERQAGLRAIQNFYIDQLEQVNKLTGAEKDRAKAVLDNVVAIKTQLVDMNALRKEADHLNEMRQAAIGASAASGDLSHLQQLAAQSEANAELLKSLEAQRDRLAEVGLVGSDAYKKLGLEIVKLRGETDLLGNEVNATFKTAAESLVQTLIDTKSPQKALAAFGKSLGASLSKALVDEASKTILDFFKESGVIDFAKGLFKGIGNFFSPTGHTGAVIGYGGSSKPVSPLAFIGAPRYHGGGLPGLRRDEVAFIGLKGEEVLAKNDPRNVLNGGKNAKSSAPAGVVLQLHPDVMHMTLRDWFERELARTASTS